MKYIKLFEKFSKEYQTKIDLKDFKKIKKGSMIQYMGGPVEVVDNNGYVLKLKDKDGKTFTVNKSQFDHGGRIAEVSDGPIKKKKKAFHPDMMYEAVSRSDKAIKDLEKQGSQIDYLDDADTATKKIWKKAGINTDDQNTIILYSYVSGSWPDTKKILNKYNVDYKELEDPNSAGESFIVFVKESVNELRRDSLSGTMAGSIESLEDRKYELKKDAKGATIGSFSNVTLPKGTIIYNLPGGVFADHFSLKNKYASRSSQGPQYFDKPNFKGIMIKSTPAVLSYIEKNSKVLESVNEAKDNLYLQLHKKYAEQIKRLKANKIKKLSDLVWVQRSSMSDREDYFDMDPKLKKSLSAEYNEERKLFKKYMARDHSVMLPKGTESLRESSAKDGGDKSNGNSHHEDHKSNSIAQHWKDTYGEDFHTKYPAIAKIVKSRPGLDKRELKRIWDETYGENFEEQYPALWQKMD